MLLFNNDKFDFVNVGAYFLRDMYLTLMEGITDVSSL